MSKVNIRRAKKEYTDIRRKVPDGVGGWIMLNHYTQPGCEEPHCCISFMVTPEHMMRSIRSSLIGLSARGLLLDDWALRDRTPLEELAKIRPDDTPRQKKIRTCLTEMLEYADRAFAAEGEELIRLMLECLEAYAAKFGELMDCGAHLFYGTNAMQEFLRGDVGPYNKMKKLYLSQLNIMDNDACLRAQWENERLC